MIPTAAAEAGEIATGDRLLVLGAAAPVTATSRDGAVAVITYTAGGTSVTARLGRTTPVRRVVGIDRRVHHGETS